MRSVLKKKHVEATRLLELYTLYKDSEDDWRRKKVHVDLDRFLMENRETAIMCIERVLGEELQYVKARPVKRPPLYKRLFGRKGGVPKDGTQLQSNAPTRDA